MHTNKNSKPLQPQPTTFQMTLFEPGDFLSIKEASAWATQHLKKTVTSANITYLINYGRIHKYSENGVTLVSKYELLDYYKSFNGSRQREYVEKLGEEINWDLSFDKYTEKETTKHVHRLHPYKGKFIPQLVEYFLDLHTDSFKRKSYFSPGDIIIDPFCGSGTTLVQAKELNINAIGIDISYFNSFITKCKLADYDVYSLQSSINQITIALKKFLADKNSIAFEEALLQKLNLYNNKYFPSPDYKRHIIKGDIDEDSYGKSKEEEFLPYYFELVDKFGIKLKQESSESFLDKWYISHVRDEIDFVYNLIRQASDQKIQDILKLILSRTIRSCRATTHSDLATLLEPVITTYYCKKHGKICKPLFSILRWWETYTRDTLIRIQEFSRLKTDTSQICLTGDSRTINLIEEVGKYDQGFSERIQSQKINGIFSSPPYVGLIDYHEQHAYAYDLFGIDRNDANEIGPLFRGSGKEARELYVSGISNVLVNLKQYFKEDYNVLLVANDKFGLYPRIAELSGMMIVEKFHRPVLNRTEKDKNAYSETVFLLKEKNK